jgi:hypothetical protein
MYNELTRTEARNSIFDSKFMSKFETAIRPTVAPHVAKLTLPRKSRCESISPGVHGPTHGAGHTASAIRTQPCPHHTCIRSDRPVQYRQRDPDPPSAASVSSSPSGFSPMLQLCSNTPPLIRGHPRPPARFARVDLLRPNALSSNVWTGHVTLPSHLWTCFVPTLSALSPLTRPPLSPLRNACLSLK